MDAVNKILSTLDVEFESGQYNHRYDKKEEKSSKSRGRRSVLKNEAEKFDTKTVKMLVKEYENMSEYAKM